MARLRTILGKRNDSFRCYRYTEYYYIIFIVMLFVLPFINYYQLIYNGDYNLVDYELYYSEETQTNTPDSINKLFNDSRYTIFDNTYRRELHTTDGKLYKEVIVDANTKTYFRLDGDKTTDLTSIREYIIPEPKPINNINFNFEGYLLPLQLYYIQKEGNLSTSQWTYIPYPSIDTIIPSNWVNFWNNISIIFYCVDESNNGIAYNFNSKQSSSSSDYESKSLNIHDIDLNLKMFNVNISGQIVPDKDPYSLNSINTVYHPLPLKDDEKSKYLSAIGLDFTDIVGTLGTLFSQEGELVRIDKDITYMYQLNGFYTVNEVYGEYKFSPKKMGWYMNVNKEFNINEYMNSTYYRIFGLRPTDSWTINPNGFCIIDNGVYIGKEVKIDNVIDKILLTDVLILSSLVAVLIVLYTYPTRSRKEFEEKFKIECFIRSGTSSIEHGRNI